MTGTPPYKIYPNDGSFIEITNSLSDILKNKFTGSIIDSNHTKAWFVNGLAHKESGAAIVWKDGYEEYWLNGHRILHRNISCESFKLYVDLLRLKGLL